MQVLALGPLPDECPLRMAWNSNPAPGLFRSVRLARFVTPIT